MTLTKSTSSVPRANGHTSPLQNSTSINDDAPYESESDLSEVAIPNVDEASPATSTNHQSEFGARDSDDSESSAAEEMQQASDADFDMEDSPAAETSHAARQERSTSTESRRPAKRKLEPDNYILANPELYGLRRSVCVRCSC